MKIKKNKIDEHKKSENQKYTMLSYSNGTDNEHKKSVRIRSLGGSSERKK